MSSEWSIRKSRSIALLREQNIPYIEHLPEIESEEEAVLRNSEEIVERIRCLFSVFLAVNRNDHPHARAIVEKHKLKSRLSRREQGILTFDLLTEADLADLSWGCESLVALGWSLGAIDVMPPPTNGIGPDYLALGWSLISEDSWSGTTLRPLSDILDQRDLYYRYHWAVRDSWLKERPAPAGLIAGVVAERHRAFNWLTSDEWDDWDKVTTDT
ncbi:MAG: DUF4272 domain-containing protein [Beijerinckiaceae bacterium]|jgi:hypothetical protein|nr:DUF4272 domain-containing protein [Beijerinckiaceae bacterium]